MNTGDYILRLQNMHLAEPMNSTASLLLESLIGFAFEVAEFYDLGYHQKMTILDTLCKSFLDAIAEQIPNEEIAE